MTSWLLILGYLWCSLIFAWGIREREKHGWPESLVVGLLFLPIAIPCAVFRLLRVEKTHERN